MPLEQEQATYERELPSLLSSVGRFVLIHGDGVVGIYDTYDDALGGGYERYGVSRPFFVKRIEAIEPVQYFTRDLAPCRT